MLDGEGGSGCRSGNRGKMKGTRAVVVSPAAGKTCDRDAVAESSEDYVVGQVASSLFQNKSATCDSDFLVRLFSAPGAEKQPMYVAVARENKKRNHKEEEIITEIQGSSTKRQPFKKMKKFKKDTSLADETVANRECALAHVTEAGGKEAVQMKNRHFHLATKHIPSSEEDVQIKKKKIQVNLVKEKLKNKRTLFVGNLPVTYTAQMLKAFFKEYGQIESIRFRSLIPAEDAISKKMAAIKRKIHPNMKYVNAYVVFKEESAASNALKCNGTEITSGFHIRVDLASKSTCHDNKRSIFVGNLPYEIDDDTVRNHFLECGNVTGVRIVRDRNMGIGKGFGYVLFETTDAVHLALKLNQSELQGRKLRVQRCVKREKAEQKNSDKNAKSSVGLKYTKTTSLKNVKGSSSNSFVGEKADPMKKCKKAKSKNSMKKMRKPK
ncbi:RNA-binding protein 34 [Candoia aspera]|uniref:RNA-binding protein 34 n=1 Tax=Candoia aspera TaxID=51853 RepID=UPI002FD7F7F3